jgi:hypothetical protein
MSLSLEFSLGRGRASSSAQKSILLKWEWPGKTPVQWDTQIGAVETQKEVASDANADVDLQRVDLDEALKLLHNRTGLGLTLLRSVYRNNRPKTRALAGLSARGQARHEILDEAQAFESMWRKLDPAWVPAVGQTLTLFKTDRELCISKVGSYADAKSTWRIESEELNQQQEDLNTDCVDWYEAVTAMFPEGTPEGDMIRGTVPTTTDTLLLPEQALVLLNASPGPGIASLSLESDHASRFDVYRKGPGETEFTLVGTDVPPGEYVNTGLPLGSYFYKAVGKNSRGPGPESGVASITVT